MVGDGRVQVFDGLINYFDFCAYFRWRNNFSNFFGELPGSERPENIFYVIYDFLFWQTFLGLGFFINFVDDMFLPGIVEQFNSCSKGNKII